MWSIVFASVAILFAALYLLLRRSIKRATKQLRAIHVDPLTNWHVHLSSPDKQLEALLVEVNQLLSDKQAARIVHERKEQDIRRQISSITHDLRTPLTSILGYIELLKEGNISDEEARQYMAVVERRAKALRSLIAGFYDLARIEANDYPMVLQKVDLHVSLKRVLADYYSEITAAGFEVTIDLPEESCPVIADEEIVMRIYTNVLQNALKHGRRSLYLFQGVRNGQYVTILTNETSSLQEADVPYLFERSFTADKSRSENNTGLGLAVVKGLIEQLGYQVDVEYNAPMFTIYLKWGRLHHS